MNIYTVNDSMCSLNKYERKEGGFHCGSKQHDDDDSALWSSSPRGAAPRNRIWGIFLECFSPDFDH